MNVPFSKTLLPPPYTASSAPDYKYKNSVRFSINQLSIIYVSETRVPKTPVSISITPAPINKQYLFPLLVLRIHAASKGY